MKRKAVKRRSRKDLIELPEEMGGEKRAYSGEPLWYPLRRYRDDFSGTMRSMPTNISCCECGFKHLYAFDVVRAQSGRWWLGLRAFSVDETRLEDRGLKIVKIPKKRRKK